MRQQRVLIILPAWNEQEALPGVLAEITATLPWADVLVVNDGSYDNTAAVAMGCGVTVLDLPLNLGVGGAMRAGYKYALQNGYDVAIQLDADGQHDPAMAPKLLTAMDEQGADLVVGARFAGVGEYRVHGPRKWAMRLLAWSISRLAGTKLTDTTSGFKASNRRAISLFARDYPMEYLGDTIESLVVATRSGLVIRQVPVVMRERWGGAPSQHPWKAALYLGRAVIALVIARSRPATVLPKQAT